MRGLDDSKSAVRLRTLESWQSRRAVLADQLAEHPGHEWAWLWRLRMEVLTYLIRCHDDAGRLTPAGVPSAGDRTATDALRPSPSNIEALPSYPPSVPSGMPGRPAKPRPEMSRRLRSLTAANRERHRQAERDIEAARDEAAQKLKQVAQAMSEKAAATEVATKLGRAKYERMLQNIDAMIQSTRDRRIEPLFIDDMDDREFLDFMTRGER